MKLFTTCVYRYYICQLLEFHYGLSINTSQVGCYVGRSGYSRLTPPLSFVLQSSTKRWTFFAKHYPGSARQKFLATQGPHFCGALQKSIKIELASVAAQIRFQTLPLVSTYPFYSPSSWPRLPGRYLFETKKTSLALPPVSSASDDDGNQMV